MELAWPLHSENRCSCKIAESAWDEPGEAGFPNSKDQDWDLCASDLWWKSTRISQKKPTREQEEKDEQKLSKIESFRWNLSLTPSHRELWNTNWTLEAALPWGKKGILETPTTQPQ